MPYTVIYLKLISMKNLIGRKSFSIFFGLLRHLSNNLQTSLQPILCSECHIFTN